jgi:hypothetical protein
MSPFIIPLFLTHFPLLFLTRGGLCDYVQKYSFLYNIHILISVGWTLIIVTPGRGPLCRHMEIMRALFLKVFSTLYIYSTYKNSFIK